MNVSIKAGIGVLLAAFLLTISFSTASETQNAVCDEAQIVALIKKCDAKFKEGDYGYLFRQFVVGGSVFGGNGGNLVKFDSQERIDSLVESMKNMAANGFREEHRSRDIDVTVSPDGNEAVATLYSDAQVQMPGDDAMKEMKLRATMILVKRNAQWRIFHVHASELKAQF